MEQTEIYNKVVGIITPFVKNEKALPNIGNDTKILDDLEVNSARLVDIILEFEDEFDVEVDDDSADKVQTIGDAVELIAKLLN